MHGVAQYCQANLSVRPSVCPSICLRVHTTNVTIANEMERWSGRVALVTGGSMGIGEAIVRRLASHGLKVVTCALEFDRLQVITQSATLCAFL